MSENVDRPQRSAGDGGTASIYGLQPADAARDQPAISTGASCQRLFSLRAIGTGQGRPSVALTTLPLDNVKE